MLIFNTNVKKISFAQKNFTKNAFFFLSLAPTHHSFTFNSQFLYELRHIIYLSKTVCGIFHFRFRKFLYNKKYGLFDFKISCHTQFCSQTFDF